MRKRYLIASLAVVMVVCLALAGCQLHFHDYGSPWKSDETNHWKECSCGEISNLNAHVVADWTIDTPATETQVGSRHGTCTVCGSSVVEEIPAQEHSHQYGETWLFDNTNHWKECQCGDVILLAEHTVNQWIEDIPATETTEGSKHGNCNVCGLEVVVTIPLLNHTHMYGNWKSDENIHWKECQCGEKSQAGEHTASNWIVDTPATVVSSGTQHKECVVCGYLLETQSIPQLQTSTKTVDIYAINDFHGAVDYMSTVAGYLTQVKNQNINTVLLNSGDMFQGSMESNSNYGKLLSACMDDVGFDAFTFGNHEFDWGLSKLEELSQSSVTPFLCANLYHWNAATKTWGTFADELAQEYTIKLMPNGLKVGIIGVIGKDQITSICSNLVQTVGFKDPADIIPSLSDKLRNQLGCDVVIVSAHTGQSTFLEDNSFDITNYVDAVFCAHTHQAETYIKNGVAFIQGGSYGKYVSHISLDVSDNGVVSCKEYTNIPYSYSWPNKLTVSEKIDNSNEQIREEANQVLTNLNGNLGVYTGIPRLVCNAIADYATQYYDDLDLVMVNQGRKTIYSGEVTYSNLYEAVPFDNQVYIAMASGADILKEAGYDGNEIWRISGTAIENSNDKYYKIAVIDYLLYHQNSSRNYNYFPSAFISGFEPVVLENSNYEMYNYRFITRDFLLQHNTINAYDYNNVNVHTDKSSLGLQVEYGSSDANTPTEPTHAGSVYDPYSVSDALIVAAQNTDRNSAPTAYVFGTVCDVSKAALSSTSGDLYNIYICDESGATILVYYLRKFQGATSAQNWTSTSEIQVGDTILVCMSIFTYNGSTPELYSGYLLELNGAGTS